MSFSAVVKDYNDNSLDGETKVSQYIATSLGLVAEPLKIVVSSTSSAISSFNVKINGSLVVSGGVPQSGRFSSTVVGTSLEKTVTVFFTSSSEKFQSYEIVRVEVTVGVDTLPLLSFRVEDTIAPTLDGYTLGPQDGSSDNHPRTPIFFRLNDQGSQVVKTSVNVVIAIDSKGILTSEDAIINGIFQTGYSGSLTSIGNSLDVFLQKVEDFPSKSQVEVQIQAEDEGNPITASYGFEILDIEPPTISGLVPAANSLDNFPDTSIALVWSDVYGSFLNPSTLQMKINGEQVIKDGYFQASKVDLGSSYLLKTPSSANPEQIVVVVKLLEDLPSGFPSLIYSSIEDNKGNRNFKQYSFRVKDYLAPKIENQYPIANATEILPSSKVRFSLVEDLDGYGLDFSKIAVELDGYSVLNQLYNLIPIDGYNSDYISRTFSDTPFSQVALYQTPKIDGYYSGYTTKLTRVLSNRVDFEIEKLGGFEENKLINVKVAVEDLGSNGAIYSYNFTTGVLDQIQTTAFPDTGTYKNFIDGYGSKEGFKFLNTTGVVLTSNIENAIIVYTLDGTLPRVSADLEVQGTTKVYSSPIYINNLGLNVLRFFAIDQAGNKESVKQEIYMIDSVPPIAEEVGFIKIIADITLQSTIVPLEFVEGLSSGQLIRILDDFRPPVYTTILAINSTSSPPFILVRDSVERLKTSRNARIEFVEQPIVTSEKIDFDTTKTGEEIYIGSRSDQNHQADSVIENLRILNRASTDEEILADYTLQVKGSKFFNQLEAPALSSEFSILEKQRVNLPDQTLVLIDFDGTVENKQRFGELQNNPRSIVDVNAASNDVIITVYVKSSEKVDRELLREVLQNYAPADLNVTVRYEEIG